MIKLFWATKTTEKTIGNLYGYRVHNETLLKYVLMRDDIKIVENVEDANVCLYITTPEFFETHPGKLAILFTMFEGTEIPQLYIDNIQKADFLITPSNWVRDLFSQYYDPKKIFVVNHGVEANFKYHKRKLNPKHFRYLWLGAANPRKGWQELINIWEKLGFWKDDSQELYIKTTGVPNCEIRRNQNVILDSRNLPRKDIPGLYYDSHCFVFPTRGEGFGLTLAEAMATGLPSISTHYSGVIDFFDSEVGYPISYKMGKADLISPHLGDLGFTQVAYPNVEELFYWMVWVRTNYKKALVKGRMASIRIKEEFTWEQSAWSLIDAIKTAIEMRGNHEENNN